MEAQTRTQHVDIKGDAAGKAETAKMLAEAGSDVKVRTSPNRTVNFPENAELEHYDSYTVVTRNGTVRCKIHGGTRVYHTVRC